MAEPLVVSRTTRPIRSSVLEAPVDGLVSLGFRFALGAVGAQALLQLTNAWLLDERVTNFSADADGNLLAWAGSAAIFAAACAAGVLALTRPAQRLPLALLAAALAFLSMDETAAIHERIGQAGVDVLNLGDEDYGRMIWPVIFFPLLVAVLIGLLRLANDAPPEPRRAIFAGAGLLAAAVAAEILWSAFPLSGGDIGSWPDDLEVAFEEGLELAGWIVVASGITAIALADAVGVAVRAAKSGA
jgi:hypothetical protein